MQVFTGKSRVWGERERRQGEGGKERSGMERASGGQMEGGERLEGRIVGGGKGVGGCAWIRHLCWNQTLLPK